MAGRVALILGGAACVWTDVEAALDLGEYQAVIACNDVMAVWPGKLDALVTLHPEKAGFWLERRRRNGFPDPARIAGHTNSLSSGRIPPCVKEFVEYRFPGQEASGSSGLFAVKYALMDIGVERAVLCGVPMSVDEAHFYDARPWGGAIRHRKGWEESWEHTKHRVRSMSGWTMSMLGRPTSAWIEGKEA